MLTKSRHFYLWVLAVLKLYARAAPSKESNQEHLSSRNNRSWLSFLLFLNYERQIWLLCPAGAWQSLFFFFKALILQQCVLRTGFLYVSSMLIRQAWLSCQSHFRKLLSELRLLSLQLPCCWGDTLGQNPDPLLQCQISVHVHKVTTRPRHF